MGKSYLFECEKCGYRAAVAGGFSEGMDLRIQTILCRDCRALYDCVVAIQKESANAIWQRIDQIPEGIRPNLTAALNRLPSFSLAPKSWNSFELECPLDATHRIQEWTNPGRCPRCKAYLERGALPFRIWD